MYVNDNDMDQLMQTVLSTMLELTPTMTGHDALPPKGTRTFSAVVHVTGAVDGAVVLHVTEPFARLAAARMFGIDPDAATLVDLQDAMGELTNVVGGNYKSFLPEPSRLSLPTVVEGTDYSFRIPGSAMTAQYGLDVQGQPLLVRLWRKEADPAGRVTQAA